jgi:hypothetical protein
VDVCWSYVVFRQILEVTLGGDGSIRSVSRSKIAALNFAHLKVDLILRIECEINGDIRVK